MNTVTPVACSAAPRTNSYRWFAALALVGALAFSFALPGVASASEGGLRHNVLMRGQVLEKGDETLVVCVISEEHTSELQSLMRITYAVFCLNNKNPCHHQYLVTMSTA